MAKRLKERLSFQLLYFLSSTRGCCCLKGTETDDGNCCRSPELDIKKGVLVLFVFFLV